MASIMFYAKPGCRGNRRQRQALERAGHRVEEVDLLRFPWSAATLMPFLRGAAVGDWFNRSAPAIKSGAVRPEQLAAEAALALLLAQPLLIRRPLLRVEGQHLLGFDPERLAALLGTALTGQEACPHPDHPCNGPNPTTE